MSDSVLGWTCSLSKQHVWGLSLWSPGRTHSEGSFEEGSLQSGCLVLVSSDFCGQRGTIWLLKAEDLEKGKKMPGSHANTSRLSCGMSMSVYILCVLCMFSNGCYPAINYSVHENCVWRPFHSIRDHTSAEKAKPLSPAAFDEYQHKTKESQKSVSLALSNHKKQPQKFELKVQPAPGLLEQSLLGS